MAKVDVWMPLYIGDYLADTSRLSTEQHGAYLLLIMDYWRNGPPPDNDEVLSIVTRSTVEVWKKMRPLISSFFQISEGAWRQSRIDKERSSASQNKSVKSANGKAGAASKWGDDGDQNKLKRSERLANARKLGTHTPLEWLALRHVCGDSCLKCGSDGELVKDHIKPIYQPGASDAIENIQPLCRACNAAKGSDSTDHRPSDWMERMAECMAKTPENDLLTPNPSPSPSPLPLPVKENSKTKSRADATASRLPADWLPTDGDKEFCKTERPDLAVDATAARFRDYWHSIPGAKGRKLDWSGTWRNWVRNERRANNGPPDKFDPVAYVNRNRNKP